MHQNGDEHQKQKQPTLFFDLIQIVGSKGNYQKISLILWCLAWYIDGAMLLSTPFLFYMHSYRCSSEINNCNQYVCSLSYQNRSSFLINEGMLTNTLANQFGDYHCERSFQIQLSQSVVYFGCFVGYFVFALIIDNLGRKPTLLISLFIAFVGTSLLAFSNSLKMAQIGLFMIGVGLDSSTSACFYFVTQTVQNSLRQKYSVIVQSCFCIGGFGCTLYYFVFSNWRLIIIIFYMIPLAVLILAIFFFIEETPQFLLIHNNSQTCVKSLQKIRAINGQNQQKFKRLITIKTIENMQQQYKQKQILSNKRIFTPFDLISKKSLRTISLLSWVLSFNTFLMFYGPIMLLKDYDMNVFVVSISMLIANIIVYPISYFYISKMQRRKWAGIMFIGALICSIFMAFMHHSKHNFIVKLQLVFIFVYRFCISFQFTLLIIQINQLFPAQVRGLGVGMAFSCGTIGSTSSSIIFGQLQKSSFPVMSVLIILGVTSLLCQWFIPQTLNVHLKQQIDEFGVPNQKNQKQFVKIKIQDQEA